MLRAADRHGIQVIWDLMHFGWPADIDVFAPGFPKRFARYAGAFARWYSEQTDSPPMLAPINEISFISWAGADVRCMNPFESARGVEMKVQLVRASIEAIEAIRHVLPHARFLQPEPVINIVPHPEHPKTWRRVEADNLLQYQLWDMLTGRIWPSLGGDPKYLDIVGVNYYSDNQFMLDGTTITQGDLRYRPFSSMLLDVWNRYGRPMVVSETGHEGDARAPWLRYVCEECILALNAGCELHGVTLYPVVNTLGWGDDRRCENGLWDDADEQGQRPIYAPLAEEIERQTPRLTAARERVLAGYGMIANSG
jgi:beta-glucosidase/6-phospho-beta-glucosidase/beta-galactosidase